MVDKVIHRKKKIAPKHHKTGGLTHVPWKGYADNNWNRTSTVKFVKTIPYWDQLLFSEQTRIKLFDLYMLR